MLLKQARMVYWKRWAAKHECEESKEGVWLELTRALLRRKTCEAWTVKHRHVTRKLVVEGGWVQKSLHTAFGWSDDKKCRGCNQEEGIEKHRLYHCPSWREVRNRIPEGVGKWEQTSTMLKNGWKWPGGIASHLLSEGKLEEEPLVGPKVGIGQVHKTGACLLKASVTMSPPMALCWEFQAGGAHAPGRWCSSTKTRRWGRCVGCVGHWIQNWRCSAPSKELTAFLCQLRKAVGPAMVHVDNEGIIDGLWRGDMKCTGPKAKDAALWILIWEELQRVHQEGILVEVSSTSKRIAPRRRRTK